MGEHKQAVDSLGLHGDQRLGLRKSPFTFCVTLMYIKAGTVKTKSTRSPCPICKGLKMVTFLMVFLSKFVPCTLLSLNKSYFELFFCLARENFLKLKSSVLEENNDPGNERMEFESVKWTVGVEVPVAILSRGTGSTWSVDRCTAELRKRLSEEWKLCPN